MRQSTGGSSLSLGVVIALLSLSSVSLAQVVETASLPGMEITSAIYDIGTEELQIEVGCTSEVEITAWAIEVKKIYSNGLSALQSVTEDFVVQLIRRDLPIDRKNPARGLCKEGEKRQYKWQIAASSGDYLLMGMEVRVAALVLADKRALGSRTYLRMIEESRAERAEAIVEWQEELDALFAAPDTREAVRSLREAKETEAVALARNSASVSPLAVRARERARELAQFEKQVQTLNLDARSALQDARDRARLEAEIYAEHANIVEVQ